MHDDIAWQQKPPPNLTGRGFIFWEISINEQNEETPTISVWSGFSAFLGGMYMKIKTYKQINIIRRKTVLQIFYQAQYIKAAQALHSGKTGYFQLNWSFVWKRRPFQQDLPEKYVFLHGQYGVCYWRLSHSSLYTIKNSIIQPKATAAVAIPAIR